MGFRASLDEGPSTLNPTWRFRVTSKQINFGANWGYYEARGRDKYTY